MEKNEYLREKSKGNMFLGCRQRNARQNLESCRFFTIIFISQNERNIISDEIHMLYKLTI